MQFPGHHRLPPQPLRHRPGGSFHQRRCSIRICPGGKGICTHGGFGGALGPDGPFVGGQYHGGAGRIRPLSPDHLPQDWIPGRPAGDHLPGTRYPVDRGGIPDAGKKLPRSASRRDRRHEGDRHEAPALAGRQFCRGIQLEGRPFAPGYAGSLPILPVVGDPAPHHGLRFPRNERG